MLNPDFKESRRDKSFLGRNNQEKCLLVGDLESACSQMYVVKFL